MAEYCGKHHQMFGAGQPVGLTCPHCDREDPDRASKVVVVNLLVAQLCGKHHQMFGPGQVEATCPHCDREDVAELDTQTSIVESSDTQPSEDEMTMETEPRRKKK